MTKVCTKCEIEKSIDDFGMRYSGRYVGQPRNWCKECGKKNTSKWVKSHPERAKQRQDENHAKRKLQRETNPEGVKAKNRQDHLRKLGIGQDGYDFLFIMQEGKCALCRSSDPTSNGFCRTGAEYFAIDHDHSHHLDSPTKMCRECIRGLLCYSCNGVFLGQAEKHTKLQTEIVKQYLKGRPLLALRNLMETMIRKINEESQNMVGANALVT